jgi:hypothetical protein
MIRNAITLWLLLVFAAAAFAQTGPNPSERCAALTKLQIPGVALEVTNSEWHAAGKTPAQPGPMKATGQSLPGRSRPLCPYPQHTHYKGQGDTQDAANFNCRE